GDCARRLFPITPSVAVQISHTFRPPQPPTNERMHPNCGIRSDSRASLTGGHYTTGSSIHEQSAGREASCGCPTRCVRREGFARVDSFPSPATLTRIHL